MSSGVSSDSAHDPVDRALLRWLGSEPGDRESMLDEICTEHPDLEPVLRRRARHLLDTGLLDSDSSPMRPLDRLGPFRLQHMIGGGGMGVVYLARQDRFDRPVAVKLLRPEYQLFERSRERFRREIAAVSRLQHPGIVPVYDCGEDQNVLYLAMEHVAGMTLAELLQALPHRSVERMRGNDVLAAVAERAALLPALRELCRGSWTEFCVRLAVRIATALQHAHERGVVHRDVKPSNVILGDDGRVMLMDFGLAQATGATKLTASGAEAGSLPYMAPEQLRGESADARTDVYGLAITLYELLTLRCPYWEDGPEPLRRRILEARPVPLRQQNRAVSRELEVVCHKAMDPFAPRRYRSAAAFANDLTAVLERRPITARPTPVWRRCARWCQRHPTAVVALVAGVVLAVGAPLLVNLSLRAQRDEALQQAYSAHVVAAAYYLSIHNALGARQQLQACPRGLRGFEWHHLDRMADQSLARLPNFRGYFAAVHWAGDALAHAEEATGTVSAVSAADGEPMWQRSFGALRWADVSADGESLAVAVDEPTIARIDTATGTILQPWTVPGGNPARWLQYLSANGGLAVASLTGEVAVLDATGALRWQLVGLPNASRAVSPDGTLLLAADLDEQPRAELWDLRAGQRLAEVGTGRFVWSAAFRGDGEQFAIGCEEGIIETFDRHGNRLASMAGHAGRTVNALCYGADGTLFSVGNDCTLQSWEPDHGVLLETRYGHESIVLDLDLHATDGRIATISPFDGVRIWDRHTVPHRSRLEVAKAGAEGLAWSADGRLLHVACQDGTCRVWDAEAGRAITSFDAGARLCGCARDGDRLLGIGFDPEHALVWWDMKSGGTMHRVPVAGYQDIALAVHPRSGIAACGHADGSIRVIERATGRERARLDGPGDRVTALAFVGDGAVLGAGDQQGNLCLVEAATGRQLAAVQARGAVLAIESNGAEIWSGEGNEVVVRDAATLAELRVLSGHQGQVHDLSIARDGARVASASHDGTVRIWHSNRDGCLLVLTGSGSYVYSVAFDPAGQRLAAGCGDGSVYVWAGSPR